MANIVHMGGGGSSEEVHMNIFCQPDEPSKKDGIWIQCPNSVIPLKYIVKKYFAQFGNFLGDKETKYRSVVFNSDNITDTYWFEDRFLWRPFVGNTSIYFVGAEVKIGRDNNYTWTESSQLNTFSKSGQTFTRTSILSGGYTGTNSLYGVEAGTNAFEVNGYFYIYSYYQSLRDGKPSSSSYVARKYDKTGLITSSTSSSDSFPHDYFAIGSVREEVYAIDYDSFNSSTTCGGVIDNARLYKVELNGFVPLFTYTDKIPSLPTTQRGITTYDSNFYFATKSALVEYDTVTKEKTTYSFANGYSYVPSIITVGSQIFVTDMSLSSKRTLLFDVHTKLFSQIPHSDSHSYAAECFLCQNDDRLLVFPGRYKEDDNKDNRDSADMQVTSFDITKDVLENNTVAIEDNPVYDAIFYESENGELYLRGLFGEVWLYENDDYQDYPTYVGNGKIWRKVKN